MGMGGWRDIRVGIAHSALVAACLLLASPARAVDIELTDVAPDRVERQRAYARGAVPFPSTPDLDQLDQRLAAKGLAKGSPILVRIFKASSELELWIRKGDTFVLLDTYPICHWTGTLGPKLKEGDKQSPEGFYSVSNRQMRLVGRWQKAFNIGFPNHLDQIHKRTGSFILVHGGCSSVGCFAMTEQVQEEIYTLANAAIKAGQERFHVHIFPFRMTPENLAAHAASTWAPFWRDLKAGHDSFERTRMPPRLSICEQRYHVRDGEPGDSDAKPMSLLRPSTPAQGSDGLPACQVESDRAASQAVTSAKAEGDGETRRRPKRVPTRSSANGSSAAREKQSPSPNG